MSRQAASHPGHNACKPCSKHIQKGDSPRSEVSEISELSAMSAAQAFGAAVSAVASRYMEGSQVKTKSLPCVRMEDAKSKRDYSPSGSNQTQKEQSSISSSPVGSTK